jgi:hypothetical protein
MYNLNQAIMTLSLPGVAQLVCGAFIIVVSCILFLSILIPNLSNLIPSMIISGLTNTIFTTGLTLFGVGIALVGIAFSEN